MKKKTHKLKTWSVYFKEVKKGNKTFEVRKNDRDFKVGDLLCLEEYYPESDYYTGSEYWAKITYILEGGCFGIEKGFVVLGMKKIRM